MINEMRDFVLELVQSEYETGHRLAEDRNEFNDLCRDEGYRATKAMYDLYEECHNLGPAGFYAEYKDELDFDPMFVSEYGDEDDEGSYLTGDDLRVAIDEEIPFIRENIGENGTLDDAVNDFMLGCEESNMSADRSEVEAILADYFDSEIDDTISEALSNREKLKRAYPELNFDNPEAEPLTEAIDTEDKMQTAVGILYDMDNFVLSVYDNDYWLAMGVPDGEFTENDRDLAEANYGEHQWLIEDDDGNFDAEAFRDLSDAFQTATRGRDYDQNDRARIIHEAEIIASIDLPTGYTSDKQKRLLSVNEDILTEAPSRVSRTLDREVSKQSKFKDKIKKNLDKILNYGLNRDNKFYIDGEWETFDIFSKRFDSIKSLVASKDLSPEEAKKLIPVINVVVVDKDGWIIRRGLEIFKPGKLEYRATRRDTLDIDPKYTAESVFSIEEASENPPTPETSETPETPSTSETSETPATSETSTASETPTASEPDAQAASEADSQNTPESTNSDSQSNNTESSNAQEASPIRTEADTFSDFVKAVKLLKPQLLNNDGKRVEIDRIKPEETADYWITINNKEYQLDKFIAAAKKNGLLESYDLSEIAQSIDDEQNLHLNMIENLNDQELDESMTSNEWKSLLSIAKNIGIETLKDLDTFAKNDVATDETLLDAMKRYKGELEGDIELLDEVFSENVVNEEFCTYSDIRHDFEANKINFAQREAFESMLVKASKALKTDPELVFIYKDLDREFDPIYFADDSKELQYNVLKVRVFDLDVVRIEFKGTIYIVFRNQADADIYMNYAH